MRPFIVHSIIIALFAFLLGGCDDNVSTPSTTQTTTQNYLLRAEDFDLSTVVGLLNGGQATDASSLQTKINESQSGINNVDVDRDGQIDMILVRETQNAANRAFEFNAVPSGNPNGEHTLVATIRFDQVNGQVNYYAGYPEYVHGYHDHYYNNHLLANAIFATWLYSSHPLYVPVYSAYHYVPYRVRPYGALTTMRTSYVSTYRVSPARSMARPATFNTANYRVPSRYQSAMFRANAPSTNFGSRAGAQPTFRPSNTNVNTRSGSGGWFGSRSPSTTRATTTTPSTRSWSRSPSRSWSGSRSRR